MYFKIGLTLKRPKTFLKIKEIHFRQQWLYKNHANYIVKKLGGGSKIVATIVHLIWGAQDLKLWNLWVEGHWSQNIDIEAFRVRGENPWAVSWDHLDQGHAWMSLVTESDKY